MPVSLNQTGDAVSRLHEAAIQAGHPDLVEILLQFSSLDSTLRVDCELDPEEVIEYRGHLSTIRTSVEDIRQKGYVVDNPQVHLAYMGVIDREIAKYRSPEMRKDIEEDEEFRVMLSNPANWLLYDDEEQREETLNALVDDDVPITLKGLFERGRQIAEERRESCREEIKEEITSIVKYLSLLRTGLEQDFEKGEYRFEDG